MKKSKVILAFLVCLMCCLIIPQKAMAQDGWGTFGDNINWHFYEKTGTLKITGKGAMPGGYHGYDINFEKEYSDIIGESDPYADIPWKDYQDKVTKLVIGEGITAICDEAFEYFKNLTEVEFPSTLKIIAKGAFYTSGIKNLVLPDGLLALDLMCFGWSDNLESVYIPGSLKYIPNACFEGCKNLKKVTISEGVEEIGFQAFKNSIFEELVIPKSVTKLDNDAFAFCEGIKHLVVPATVKEMGDSVFFSCDGLYSVDFQAPVDISDSAFSSCSNLQIVKLNNKVKSIGYFAFHACDNLKALYIPKSVTKIDDAAFYGLNHEINFYTVKGKAAYNFAGTHKDVNYVNVAKAKGEKEFQSAWKYVTGKNAVKITKATLGNKVFNIKVKAPSAKSDEYIVYYSKSSKGTSPSSKVVSAKNDKFSIETGVVYTSSDYYIYIKGRKTIGGRTYYSKTSDIVKLVK